MPENFADLVLSQIQSKNSRLFMGLTPDLAHTPSWISEEKVREFGRNLAAISESITCFERFLMEAAASDIIGIVPRLSNYLMYGAYGIRALELIIVAALEKELLVIVDARSLGHIADVAASTFIGKVPVLGDEVPSNLHSHAVTVAAGQSLESVATYTKFAKEYSRGVFVVAEQQMDYAGLSGLAEELIGANGISGLGIYADSTELLRDSDMFGINGLKLLSYADFEQACDRILELSEPQKRQLLICFQERQIYDKLLGSDASELDKDLKEFARDTAVLRKKVQQIVNS